MRRAIRSRSTADRASSTRASDDPAVGCRIPRQSLQPGFLAVLVCAVAISAATPRSMFLRDALHLSSADVESLENGDAVVKSLQPVDSHGIAVVGLIQLPVTPSLFVDRIRDITHFKRDQAVLQIGTFSDPPRLGDVAALDWPADDLRALRHCRVADCDLRLSAEAIERIRHEIDWSSPQHDAQAADLARHVLVEAATAYLRGGDSALPAYHDRKQPVSARAQFLAVANASPSPTDLVPAFRRYLLEFPRTTLPDVENLLYWSKEQVGFRPVVSVTHLAIYRPPEETGLSTIIASRQIYATRYFDASLGITALMPDNTAERDRGVDLVYLNRSRTDEFEGFWGRVKRPIVRSRARAAMERYLRLLKTRFERANAGGMRR
jgi:hypothetical protein